MKKATMWISLIVGIMWVLVGLRDAFAPGFFSPNGRVVTNGQIAFDFAMATVFIVLGSLMRRQAT